MANSPNSIIHFTSSKASLKGILSENFKLKYCREMMPFKADDTVVYVPMVSFCEIPLSKISSHIEKYGAYGIGLTRDWAIKNCLNPVLYVEPNSHLSASYVAAINHFFPGDPNGNDVGGLRNIADFLRYMKPYEGRLSRGEDDPKVYRFSDEREWRYVPHHDASCEMLYTEDDYLKDGVRQEAADSLSSMRLEFEPNDIKYIVINNDSEISEFVNHLQDVKSRYMFEDVRRLTTRIITSEQIFADF